MVVSNMASIRMHCVLKQNWLRFRFTFSIESENRMKVADDIEKVKSVNAVLLFNLFSFLNL